MKWIEEKMQQLSVHDHPNFKLAGYLCSRAMITVESATYGGIVETKPLGVLWGLLPDAGYDKTNSIFFDDLRRNFLMAPENGLKIRPFKHAHQNRHTDRELVGLGRYITGIAERESDFSSLKHKRWERYVQKHPCPDLNDVLPPYSPADA